MRHVTMSNVASGNGNACASAHLVSTLVTPRSAASSSVWASIASERSVAITRATWGASATAVWPAPVAMSSTSSVPRPAATSTSASRSVPSRCSLVA